MNLSAGISKKIAHNCAENLKERTDWIRNTFPEVSTCNPYQSPKLISAIREAMKANGLYKMTHHSSSFSSDETIIRYILKAQNKKPLNKYKKPSKKQVYLGW